MPSEKMNGTCGRIHGELKAIVDGHTRHIEECSHKRVAIWSAINERVRLKIFIWATGVILTLSIVGAGVFANSINNEVEKLSNTCSEQVGHLNVRVERIREDIGDVKTDVAELKVILLRIEKD